MCLHLTRLEKHYPTKTVLDGVDWHVAPGQHWGLVGPNGAGKSTLFKIILGVLDADAGTVALRPRLTVGHLAQELLGDQGRTLQDEMWQAFPRLLTLKAELTALEAHMNRASEAELERLVHEHGELHMEWDRLEGWGADARIGRVLNGLGFTEADRGRLLAEFSGGWQMRAALAKLLLSQPELLLLDEPTNHLDLAAIGWLEGYLSGYPGALVLISHDRHFLDAVVDHVAELDGGRLETYPGNYTRYREQREARRAAQQAAFDRQQAEIERMQAWIDRFRAKATKASAVKSREKALGRLDRVEAPPDDTATIRFRFTPAPPTGRIVLTLTELSKDYGPGPLFRIERLELERGMRLALVGPNGAGKSTLMKLMAGVEQPSSGELAFGLRVLPGYFSQNQADLLEPARTVLEEAWSVDETVPLTRLRTLLGCFLFRGEDVFKPIAKLSGGERSRLALAKLLLEPRNLLLLDEPTNHLDLGAKEELAEALLAYDGTAVIISHDRWFLESAATHVLHIEDGQARLYEGGYGRYLEKHAAWLEATRAATQAAATPAPPVAQLAQAPAKVARLSYKQARALEAAEARVLALEARVAELEGALQDPTVYQDGVRAAALNSEYEQARTDLDGATEAWMALVDGA
ncbi:MAG: ABC-F family ATP-binding cassette domain-containing protein [Candidatus Sericytochromatia bacterium]|nr:ABC-F family ATP-binding cassette domain-containing protein [Candidatus Sericytochromatia bacterium]